MPDLLCAATRCAPPGRHRPACTDDTCRGCRARPAHDGLRVCLWHRNRLEADADTLPDLWHDLDAALSRASTGHTERVSGSPTRGLILNEAASDARAQLHGILAAWCAMIAAERGLTAPPAYPPAMARYVAAHTDWLAAHTAAGDACDEIHDLATGRPRAVAYPTGNRIFRVAPCPMPDDPDPTTGCPGTIWTLIRPATDYLPSELACDHNPDHRWDSTQWLRRLGPRLLAAGNAAAGTR